MEPARREALSLLAAVRFNFFGCTAKIIAVVPYPGPDQGWRRDYGRDS